MTKPKIVHEYTMVSGRKLTGVKARVYQVANLKPGLSSDEIARELQAKIQLIRQVCLQLEHDGLLSTTTIKDIKYHRVGSSGAIKKLMNAAW